MPGTNQQSVQTFLDYLKFEKRYSSHTVIAYQNDLKDFFDFLELQFGGVNHRSVSQTFVRSWLASLKEQGMTSKSINRKISSLKSYFKYQLKRGEIDITPMANISAPKISKRLPVFVKEEDTRNLLATLKIATEDVPTLNANMLLSLFYTTGMRLSELINLKEKQIDFSRAHVKVLGKGNKERIIPLSKDILDNIRGYQQWKRRMFEEVNEVLLVTDKGKKMYPKYAYLLVNRFLGTIKTLDKKSPHVLRHTFATHLMNGGADLNAVKELLGHSSLASTQVYTHNSIEKLKDIHKKAHPKA